MKSLLRLPLMLLLAAGMFAALATAATEPIVASSPIPQCPKPQSPYLR